MNEAFDQIVNIERTLPEGLSVKRCGVVFEEMQNACKVAIDSIVTSREFERVGHLVTFQTDDNFIRNMQRARLRFWLPLKDYKQCRIGELALIPIVTTANIIQMKVVGSEWEFRRQTPPIVEPPVWARVS